MYLRDDITWKQSPHLHKADYRKKIYNNKYLHS